MRTLRLLQQESVQVLLSREGELDIASDGTAVTVSREGENFLVPAA